MLKQTFLNLISKYSDHEEFNLNCWNEIETNYSSKSRHYHNLQHLESMMSELEHVKPMVADLDTLLFAIYYHDIVNKATRKDNEHRSALFFEKTMTKTSLTNSIKCMEQIEATREHKFSSDGDTNILLDLDLAILGKTREVYLIYCKNIRKEYKIYPDFLYRKGRRKALKHLLDLDPIYKTDFFIDRYEQQAKENISYELKDLTKG